MLSLRPSHRETWRGFTPTSSANSLPVFRMAFRDSPTSRPAHLTHLVTPGRAFYGASPGTDR